MKSCLTGLKGAAVTALVLSIAGCAGPGEKSLPKTYTIEISQMQFHPAELSVEKGDTVVFVNHDIVVHDITEQPGKSWSSSPLASGKSWKLVAEKDADYFCSIHPVMKGRILVK